MPGSKTGPRHQGRKGSWWSGQWFDELEFLPDEERVFPETVPDEIMYSHPVGCHCKLCRRPEAARLKAREIRLARRRVKRPE